MNTEQTAGDADALSVERVLVPVDGSDESMQAVEYAVAVADRYDAALSAVYVVGEDVVRGLESGEIDEDDVAEDNRAYLESVADMAADADVPADTTIAFGFSTRRKTQHPGSVILDVADEVSADFLVIPREPNADDEPDVLEKAAEYTLLYASQPVLSV
ncbi:Nucleotide-binding universal stress protein, UspA family [Natronoarchaeum philippinense]|uniref:Nucleotide-binding universal stress protein, UspA family n=1 Tax=Natronoarchaeum philippinense TaxID=558529 RepID=A0A285NRB6_NATPI|nr:universal stress protein [Natronoarchaeum philippinense]SNZ12062.1 Nucleotide-binding universal stress protein, UspA family [Natronoarchaeum philippinense]